MRTYKFTCILISLAFVLCLTGCNKSSSTESLKTQVTEIDKSDKEIVSETTTQVEKTTEESIETTTQEIKATKEVVTTTRINYKNNESVVAETTTEAKTTSTTREEGVIPIVTVKYIPPEENTAVTKADAEALFNRICAYCNSLGMKWDNIAYEYGGYNTSMTYLSANIDAETAFARACEHVNGRISWYGEISEYYLTYSYF